MYPGFQFVGVWSPGQQWTPACESFQPTFAARSCYCLPQPYSPAKVDPSWSPLAFADPYQECLLLVSQQILFNGTSTVQRSPALRSLSDPWEGERVTPSITLGPLLHPSTYCACLWLVVHVSSSLARRGPLGPEQCLIQCESPPVSTGPGIAKMPNKCCGFITHGQEGPHTGRWQGLRWPHS